MNPNYLAQYVRQRTGQLLKLQPPPAELVRVLADPTGEVGRIFIVGPVRVVYRQGDQTVRFYDSRARLLAADPLPWLN